MVTRREWEQAVLTDALARTPDRRPGAATTFGLPIAIVYTSDDVASPSVQGDVEAADTVTAGTIGADRRPWGIAQTATSGAAAEANGRLRHLVAAGATVLEVPGDWPTRLGRDPDHPSAAIAGDGGVSLATVDDVQRLFDGIDLRAVAVSIGVDAPAAAFLACLLVAAERQGVSWSELRGTLRHDTLGAALVQTSPVPPLAVSLRLVADAAAFCRERAPGITPVTAAGARLREAGATAADELTYVMASATTYVQAMIHAGASVDEAAGSVALAMSAHSPFFEEVAKFRAARRLWATILQRRFGAASDCGECVQIHSHTAHATLSSDDPWSNVSRVTFQALSAVLGGADVVKAAARDESIADAGPAGATLAVRTQQVMMHELGLAGGSDPLAGAWFVEHLTQSLIDVATAGLASIDRLGGLAAAVESGAIPHWPAAGVTPTASQAGDAFTARRAAEVRAWRQAQDRHAVEAAIGALKRGVSGDVNVLPLLVTCAERGATIGEMTDALFDRHD